VERFILKFKTSSRDHNNNSMNTTDEVAVVEDMAEYVKERKSI
jgi:hypothetical protein